MAAQAYLSVINVLQNGLISICRCESIRFMGLKDSLRIKLLETNHAIYSVK